MRKGHVKVGGYGRRRLTVAEIWTLVFVSHAADQLRAICQDVSGAAGLDQLIATATGCRRHVVLLLDTGFFPLMLLLQAARPNILAKKHVQRSVLVFEVLIADEHDRLEPLQDHADLYCRVPSVVTSGREIGSIKPMTSTTAEGPEEPGSIRTEVGVFGNSEGLQVGWGIDLIGSYAAVLMAFEVREVACEIVKNRTIVSAMCMAHSSIAFSEKGTRSGRRKGGREGSPTIHR